MILARLTLIRWLAALAGILYSVSLQVRANSREPYTGDFTVRSWTKQQGLPDNSVTSVLQTRDGYLWIGTAAGLARFDGMKFSLFSPQNVNTNTPVSVTALCEDSTGQLWIGTRDHGLLTCKDGMLNFFSQPNLLHSQTINCIAQDSAGTLWVGTPSGLLGIDGSRFKIFTTSNGLPNDFISDVHAARSGNLWITTRGGMCELYKDGKIEPVTFQTDSPGRNPELLGVYEDRSGKLWAYGDTYLVNLDGKQLNHFGNGDVASSRIWSLCEGRNGELWIGASGKGLYCFANDQFHTPTLHGGELGSDVRAICEDRQRNLWLGTYSDGLVRLQPRTIRVMDAGSGLPNRPAVCLAYAPQGGKWIGFDRAGFYTGVGNQFAALSSVQCPNLQNLVSSVCATSNSIVWVGTPGAGLYGINKNQCLHLTTANGLADNEIYSLGADSDETLWIGTAAGLQTMRNGHLAMVDFPPPTPRPAATAILRARNGGTWLGFDDGRVFHENRGQFHQVSTAGNAAGKSVCALCEDAAGRIWIGTAGGRLGCLAENRFCSWDVPLSSGDKLIVGIAMADDGDLWFATERSVYSLAQKDINSWISQQTTVRPQLVFQSDSVSPASPSYGWPRALKSPDGTLTFGMDNGAVTVDLAGASIDSAPPPVLIEDILVNGVQLPHEFLKRSTTGKSQDAPLRLAGERSLEIHYTGLDLSAPEKLRFRHRLDGSDLDWVVDNDLKRTIDYPTRLPYGTYTFRVQAGNANQTWFENVASFRFVVPTPLWRTAWALAAYIILAVSAAGGLTRVIFARRYRRRLAALAAQQAMERERMRIARDMHDEIGSKLTKISFMSERAKRELQEGGPVAVKLDSIAATSRDLLQTLDEIVWAVNPHNDTLEHLAAYLGQYTTEYLQNTAVECELHIPRGLPHHPLSAETRHNLFLAFEESLNNALKHGRPTRIHVQMELASSQFEIRIEDNGCGFNAAAAGDTSASNAKGGNGLLNMHQRLKTLGGLCEIQSRPGHGTTVIFKVPLASANQPQSNGSTP